MKPIKVLFSTILMLLYVGNAHSQIIQDPPGNPTGGYVGGNCGSSTSFMGKVFDYTSTDWWPSIGLADAFIGALSKALGGDWVGYLDYAKAACVVAYGQAYLGDSCRNHDLCYDGDMNWGHTKSQCDYDLQVQWIDACKNKYSYSGGSIGGTIDPLINTCQKICKESVGIMAVVQQSSNGGQIAWDTAREKRLSRAPSNSEYNSAYSRLYPALEPTSIQIEAWKDKSMTPEEVLNDIFFSDIDSAYRAADRTYQEGGLGGISSNLFDKYKNQFDNGRSFASILAEVSALKLDDGHQYWVDQTRLTTAHPEIYTASVIAMTPQYVRAVKAAYYDVLGRIAFPEEIVRFVDELIYVGGVQSVDELRSLLALSPEGQALANRIYYSICMGDANQAVYNNYSLWVNKKNLSTGAYFKSSTFYYSVVENFLTPTISAKFAAQYTFAEVKTKLYAGATLPGIFSEWFTPIVTPLILF